MCSISKYHDGSSCQSCYSQGVLECYGPLYNNAYTCVYFMNLCNNKCFCNNGYYWDGTTCSQCYTSCLNCNGPLESNCLLKSNSQTCNAGYFNLSDTCGGITYNSFFSCDSSCLTCSGPSSTNCLSCIQNATLQTSKTCLCSQGWSGTPPSCNRIYFTATLSVNASDFAIIVFSEPLSQQLTTSNLSVSINSVTQTFSIITVNSSAYIISIDFVQNITKNTNLQITMVGDIVSQNNSLLANSSLTAALYARTLGGIQECFESSYNNCYTCAPPMNLCGSICYCNNNYFWDGSNCSSCDSVCSICNGTSSGNCLLPKSSTNNVCNDGYFYYSETCDSATFSNCFVCDPTCFNCNGPYSNNCTSCSQIETLQPNKTCSCTQGWSGTPPSCNRNSFTASLSVNASDYAKLVFSESLVQQLTTSSISVFINSVSQTFSIIAIDNSNYIINIVFDQNITKGSILEISLSADIVSQKNSLLSSSGLNAALYARILGGIQECFGSIYDNCYTCASPMTLCTSICYCNINYYWDGTTCSACDSPCSICNGPLASDCLLIAISYSNVCSDGYFFHFDSCNGISYYNCFPCDPSCFDCTGPSSNECTTCMQNATLQSNNTCSCSQGWSGIPPLCDRIYFKAFLSLSASDIATITFFEPLKYQLNNSNLSVFVNYVPENFSTSMIDKYNWLIEPVYLEDISANSKLEILILGYIISEENSLLSTSKLSIIMYPIKSEVLAQQVLVQQLATIKASTQQAATASWAILGSVSLMNLNVIFLFQFLNAAEMFSLIEYFNIDLNSLFLQFIATLKTSFTLPSMIEYFVDKKDGAAVPIKYQNIRYDTNLILINSGTNLTILLGISVIVIILLIIKGTMRLLFKKKIKIINKSLVLRLFTWYWTQTLFDLTINSIVGIYLCRFENGTQIIDFICCIFVIVINK